MTWRKHRGWIGLLLFVAALAASYGSEAQLAYTGPGAGFAFLGSFLAVLSGAFLTLLSLLSWPVRMLWRTLRGRNVLRNAQVKRVIFLGLDGLDPRVAERMMDAGQLPNLARLRHEGTYSRLRTTFPALSPVAWATFATGVNPGKHNIFDFLNRSFKTYVPELSSSKVTPPPRTMRVGKWRIPLSGPGLEQRRKSTTFWKILGDHGIPSTVLRVPITFPPEKFNGKLLSAMCTPDLRGTQGTFSCFTTGALPQAYDQGSYFPLERTDGGYRGVLEGPVDIMHDEHPVLRIPFEIRRGTLVLQEQRVRLKPGEQSPWVRLRFRSAMGVAVHGVARFLLTESGGKASLYMTPINIDPEKPALPISHPGVYSVYLAKLLGTFATVGMAEDTWALNECVIDEQAFLEQAYSIYEERKAMFLGAVERSRRGVVACVFDTTDRVQHMFYRHTDGRGSERYAGVIEDLYRRMDVLVGLTMKHAGRDTAVFVLSDHGFCSFRRGIDLNAWLRDNGYLALKDGARESGAYFEHVDWTRTRAYTLGLGGVYLNLRGREAHGTVAQSDADALAAELCERLSGLRDPATGEIAIRAAYATGRLYRGPYTGAAPDIIVGFNDGYRTAWNAAVGRAGVEVFTDNDKAWSGDHCVDPHLVPGVLFSNRKFACDDPGIEDMAGTALALFGVAAPKWMDGKPLAAQAVS